MSEDPIKTYRITESELGILESAAGMMRSMRTLLRAKKGLAGAYSNTELRSHYDELEDDLMMLVQGIRYVTEGCRDREE